MGPCGCRIARSYSNDPVIALRIARSRIAQTPRAELGFWREVARYFCAHPAAVEEMNDFGDYFADCYRRNQQFSLKGRTLGLAGSPDARVAPRSRSDRSHRGRAARESARPAHVEKR